MFGFEPFLGRFDQFYFFQQISNCLPRTSNCNQGFISVTAVSLFSRISKVKPRIAIIFTSFSFAHPFTIEDFLFPEIKACPLMNKFERKK